MNAPSNIPPMQERDLRNAAGLAAASAHYADMLKATGGKHNRATEYARFKLCNAIIDLIDDGNAYAERDLLMDELRIDEEGNPERDDDARTFNASFVHPNDPCQSKGYY